MTESKVIMTETNICWVGLFFMWPQGLFFGFFGLVGGKVKKKLWLKRIFVGQSLADVYFV